MKIAITLLASLFVLGCSEAQIEEVVFRKTLEKDLVELCGEDDPECGAAVTAQIENCMIQGDWRTYLEDQDREEELSRFSNSMFDCIVDAEGNPYFESNL